MPKGQKNVHKESIRPEIDGIPGLIGVYWISRAGGTKGERRRKKSRFEDASEPFQGGQKGQLFLPLDFCLNRTGL